MSKKPLLNAPQQEAVETIYGPLLVLAGAGSGKTRVVTYRIAHLLAEGVKPTEILGLTFTNKAANEMKERIHRLTNSQVLVCTFHSLGARILRESIHLLGFERNFTIYDAQDVEKLMKLCISDVAGTEKIDVKTLLHFVSSSKNALRSPSDIDHSLLEEDQDFFPEIYAKYQAKLQEYNALDFDDLLYLPVRLFRENAEALEHYQRRWSFLLIDEYQDTNAAQYTIVQHLVQHHRNLCVVGDPDQSIYSWRGADISNILGFESDFPGAKVVRLEQSYRSCSNILEASNAVISNNSGRYKKDLWSDRGTGEKIKLFTADTERDEASFVAEKIRYYHTNHNIPLKEMAIFYRTNAQSRAFEDKFLFHRIPYVIVGGVSFYQRREIKDILAFLRLVQSGVDIVSFTRTINIPKRGIGESSIERMRLGASAEQRSLLGYCSDLLEGKPMQNPTKLSAKQKEGLKSYLNVIDELRRISASGSIKDLVKATIELTNYFDYLKVDMETYQERKENLNALVTKAAEWELSVEEPTLEAFLEELSLKSSLDEAESSQDHVNLMTIHNGKGLEFELVFLVGMEEDLFPHVNSRGNEKAVEEERRLCYVGITRAKDFLYVCDVRQRFIWGTTRAQRPSRFLKEFPPELIEKVRPAVGLRNNSPFKSQPIYRRNEEENVHEEAFSDEMDQSIPENGSFGSEAFKIGDAVFHHDFGIGIIRQVQKGSVGLTYRVFFTSEERERSLAAQYAQLRKL